MCASLGVTETQRRNESKGCLAAEVRSLLHASEAHHRPTCSTLRRGLSKSVHAGTRKMVNYA